MICNRCMIPHGLFVAFFIFKDHGVANTVAKTVKESFITLPVIMSGLIAAISWNLLTWWYGIPSSSSHTLIGGFAGAFLAAYGVEAVRSGVVWATVIFIVVVTALFLWLLDVLLSWATRWLLGHGG